MVTIDDIPDEVLEFLFYKLTLTDRKTVRLVNKHWLSVSNSTSITRHELINLKSKDLGQFTIPKAYLNLCIKVTDDDDDNASFEQQEFWIKHGRSVRSLVLRDFQLHPGLLTYIMNYCPNVRKLELRSVNEANNDDSDLLEGECAKLDFLESLFISGNIKSSAEFTRFTNSVPNLKSLKLYNVGYSDWFDTSEAPEMKTIMPIIVKQAFTLTVLKFTTCDFVTAAIFENVMEVIGPQLTGLYLSELRIDSIDCLSKHANKLSNLKNFQIIRFPLYGRFSLSQFVALHLRNLQFLSFIFTGLCDEDLTPLAALEHLKGLDISGTLCLADRVVTLFRMNALTNLIALRMADLDCVTDDLLAIVLPNLPNLKMLDLMNCEELTSAGVQTILKYCKQLTHLSLRDCIKIESVIEPVSINILANLIRLGLGYCKSLDPANILKLRFDKLERIGLNEIPLSEDMLQALLKNCPQLSRDHLGLMGHFWIFDFSTN